MKNLNFLRFTTVFVGLLLSARLYACHFSDLTLNSVVDLGAGRYELNVRFCVGCGITGNVAGAEHATGNFAFLLGGNASFADYPVTLASPQTGGIYRASQRDSNNLLVYVMDDFAPPWACISSTASCGNARAMCVNISFITQGLPQAVTALGAEGFWRGLPGCDGNNDMTVYPSVPTCPIQPHASVTQLGCTTLGNITVNPSGGQAPYSYLWSNGATTAGITQLPQDNYAVTITDANGCTLSQGYTIDPNYDFWVSGQTSYSCATRLGEATLSPLNGIAPYTYLWSNGGTSSTITHLVAGNYQGTVTDAGGCTATRTVNIMSIDPLQVNGFVTHACGNNLGSISLGISGGLFPCSFLWSNGATTQSIFNLSPGTYTVEVRQRDGGCPQSYAFTVNSFQVELGANRMVYVGYAPMGCTTLGATLMGGVAPFTYQWSTGANTSSINACPTSSTSYTVTVTDANGCAATDVVTVNVTNVRCGILLPMVNVCHAGSTWCVLQAAVQGHLNHGDYLGACHNKSGMEEVDATVALQDEDVLRAWPVPAASEVHFEIGGEQTGMGSLALYNLWGKRILLQEGIAVQRGEMQQVDVKVSDFAAGIYIAQFSYSDGKVLHLKFVVER